MKKSVAIIQSNYIPWKGYFDIIAACDEFILYDDRQFTKRDWRNRNQIKTAKGLSWLTIPVEVKGKFHQTIRETRVSDHHWAEKHFNTLRHNYHLAEYFSSLEKEVKMWYEQTSKMELLSDINFYFIKSICEKLQISTPIKFSEEFQVGGDKSQRLMELCKKTNATEYISGPKAKTYLDEKLFSEAGIGIRYFDYNGYKEYPQSFPPFTDHVTILDLLFHTGNKARNFLKTNPNSQS